MDETQLEIEALAHHRELLEAGFPGPLAAALAAQRYAQRREAWRDSARPMPGMETKQVSRSRRETKGEG